MEVTYVHQRAEEYRRQIQKIIDSVEFVGGKRLAEFLMYASEARLQGRTHLDQSEIAARILNRGPNFNPLDDASVRKMATLIRKRLEHYYKGSGAQDRIIVTLPMRSYILQFRDLDLLEGTRTYKAEIIAVDKKMLKRLSLDTLGRYRYAFSALAVVMFLGGVATLLRWQSYRLMTQNPVWELATARGDFMHGDLDLPGNAILVGSKIGDTDDIIVRMQFTPEHAVQQAGLLVFENADRYVKLGRQFLSRPALEFGLETRARYQKPPNTYIYDPDAQDGEPIWLSVRREHLTFESFISSNGTEWHKIGNTLTMPDAMPNSRVAIFADHGRTNAPVTNARFDQLSIGMEFHDFPPGPTDLSQFVGWHLVTNCSTGPGTTFRENSLAVHLGAGSGACRMEFATPVPGGDWAISTKLDFLPSDSTLAGLVVRGSKGSFRLIRWDLNGGAVTAEHEGPAQASLRDFEGSPPIILRIDCKDGQLYSSVSRDDVHYERLSLSIPKTALGEHIQYGIQVARSTWFTERDTPEARFMYIRRPVTKLANFR